LKLLSSYAIRVYGIARQQHYLHYERSICHSVYVSVLWRIYNNEDVYVFFDRTKTVSAKTEIKLATVSK